MATSTYTTEIGEEICEAICSSEKSIATICNELGYAVRTVRRWIREIPEFGVMYEQAKQDQADYSAEKTLEIADEHCSDMVEVTRQKNRIQARQWSASKLRPKTYGDNRNVAVEGKVVHQISADQYNKLLEVAAASPVVDVDHEEIE